MTRDERIAFDTVKRELERHRAWLKLISSRTRGMGSSFAAQALYSNGWPDGFSSKPPR